MSEQMGQCKWCGKNFSLSILAKFGGFVVRHAIKPDYRREGEAKEGGWHAALYFYII
jgi:hypothetical protein